MSNERKLINKMKYICALYIENNLEIAFYNFFFLLNIFFIVYIFLLNILIYYYS